MGAWSLLGIDVTLCLLYFSSVSSSGLQTAPEGSFASADALLSRLAHPASLCGALDYLEPDLAEKNPPVFAQKLQVCSPCVTFWGVCENLSREWTPSPKCNETGSNKGLLEMFQMKSLLPQRLMCDGCSWSKTPKWYKLCDYRWDKPFVFQMGNWTQRVIFQFW